MKICIILYLSINVFYSIRQSQKEACFPGKTVDIIIKDRLSFEDWPTESRFQLSISFYWMLSFEKHAGASVNIDNCLNHVELDEMRPHQAGLVKLAGRHTFHEILRKYGSSLKLQ